MIRQDLLEDFMKKTILAAAFITALFVINAPAFSYNAVGIYGNFMGSTTGGAGGGLGISLKFGNFPVLGVSWNFSPNSFDLGIACDYWVINQKLGGILDYYLGIGGYLGMNNGGGNFNLNPGARIPIGLQIWPVNKLELFLEFAPMITFLPSLNLGYSLSGGLRVAF